MGSGHGLLSQSLLDRITKDGSSDLCSYAGTCQNIWRVDC